MTKVNKVFAVIVIFTLVLSGCSNELTYINSYVFGQDEQYNFFTTYLDYMCESDTAIYFMSGHAWNYIYIYDKKSKTTVPLCNKPDCKHILETDATKVTGCNAFLGLEASCLQYYNNLIYYIDRDHTQSNQNITNLDSTRDDPIITLKRISQDGSRRETVYNFTETVMDLVIHRGYAYFWTRGSKTDKDDDYRYVYKLYRLNLAHPNENPELLDEGYELNGRIAGILCYGNSVYYCVAYYKDESFTEMVRYINIYDIINKNKKKLLDNSSSPFTVFNDKLIYRAIDQKDYPTYTCDLDGTNVKQISAKGGVYTTNGTYLVMDGYLPTETGRVVTVMDKDFNVVNTVSLDESYSMPAGCSGDYYYVSKKAQQTKYGNTVAIYAIPIKPETGDEIPGIFYEFIPQIEFPGIFKSAK